MNIKASFGLLALIASLGVRAESAHAAAPPRQFESATVAVPVGNSCLLHPDGDADPKQSIPVNVDADGVARFLALRATRPDSIEKLALDCADASGNIETYAVDLRSDETFMPRPFDPTRTSLALRPALAGDPLRFTQQELIKSGYGLRPDPQDNPDGYARWLETVREPLYLLRSAKHGTRTAKQAPALNAGISSDPSTYWIGAVMKGSYQKGASSALTTSYIQNQATFNVPSVTPGGFGTGATSISIWNGLDNVFQAIVEVDATATTASYLIHREDIIPKTETKPAQGDNAGVTFTPAAGDVIFAVEWYCDAEGNFNLSGGYSCTDMVDKTQHIGWVCDLADDPDCASYQLEPADLKNGNLGRQAEFIIEDDTAEVGGNPKTNKEWPEFSPVTMLGSALVVKGSGASGGGHSVTTTTDSNTSIRYDATVSVPFVRGDGHVTVTLPTGGVKWEEYQTNVYYWNGENFDNYSVACSRSIGVGADSRGLTRGTPWSIGCSADSAGNSNVYEMQTAGAWAYMEHNVAKQIAVSSQGKVWALTANGDVLYWNGSAFIVNPAAGCGTSIGVGPNSAGLTNGTPWITGCDADLHGNYNVYQMQSGGDWVKMQDYGAKQIAVSPEGTAWAINAVGEILYWNGSKFTLNAAGGCATSIGVGPSSSALPHGTPWITGCETAADGNHAVYELESAGAWKEKQADVGVQIAVSPEGNAWVISTLKD